MIEPHFRQVPDWIVPLIGYVLYTILFISGYFLSIPSFNVAGALLFFSILLIGNYKRMFSFKKDVTVLIAALVVFIPVLSTIASSSFDTSENIIYLVKHALFFSLYALVFSYNYTPINLNSYSKYFVVIILTLIAVSFISGARYTDNDESRLSGIFTNPNNFALMALSILFFIDAVSKTVNTYFIYGFIFLLLTFSSTSGAIISFLVGLAYRHVQSASKIKAGFVIVGIVMSVAIANLLQLHDEFVFFGKIHKQMSIVLDNLWDLNQLQSVNYGHLSAEYGASGLSGIWRLSHWLHCLTLFFNDSVSTLFFGFGVGSSAVIAGKLPHNDLLRVLVEQGLVGFFLSASFFYVIFRRISPGQRYILVIFLLYSFTENVMDNLLFAVLFVLYLATSQSISEQDEDKVLNNGGLQCSESFIAQRFSSIL